MTINEYKQMKGLNNEIERKCAEIAIDNFLNENFQFGKYTFKEFKWISNNTVEVVDRDGKKAKIKYDIRKDRVTLK